MWAPDRSGSLGIARSRPRRGTGARRRPPPQNLPARVTLDQAIDLALKHNHSLQAARTTILQNQAQEITANLRPNPVLLGDAQFLPLFNPSNFTGDYLDNSAQFDLGVGYLFERGKKRQHRLQAAKDQTAVTTAQVDDNERTLTFNVASQFIAALLAQSELDLAETGPGELPANRGHQPGAASTPGAMSEGDLLKIKIQLLQFQMDVSAAKLARVQALASAAAVAGLRIRAGKLRSRGRPRIQAGEAWRGRSESAGAAAAPGRARGAIGSYGRAEPAVPGAGQRQAWTSTRKLNYTHVAALSTASLFGSIELPIFDRNQGEIARTRYAITQSQELSSEQASIALTDVTNSYEGLRTDDEVVQLYQSGYLKEAEDSRDISQYAYQRGAASLLDFLDAERSYRATELAYRQALASYMISLEQLRQAVGTRSLP